MYSTNSRNFGRIQNFFENLGYRVEPTGRYPSADSTGEVVEFRVLRFDPSKLRGKTLEAWQSLPIEVI